MRKRIEDGLSSHMYSPNVEFGEDAEAEMYWLQFADFYEWPHIQLFNSLSHLKEMLKNADFSQIHDNMVREMSFRRSQVENGWCDVAARVSNNKCT